MNVFATNINSLSKNTKTLSEIQNAKKKCRNENKKYLKGFETLLKCLQQMRILAVRSIHSNHFVPNGLEGGWLWSWIAEGAHEFEDFNSAYFHCCLVPDVEGIGDGNNCTFFKHDLPT